MCTLVPLAFLSGVGPVELLVVFVVVLLLYGPKRLPEISKKLGRMFEDLRRASDDFKDQLMSAADEKPPADAPSNNGGTKQTASSDAGASRDPHSQPPTDDAKEKHGFAG